MGVWILKLSGHFSNNCAYCPQAEAVLHSLEGVIHRFGDPKIMLSKQVPLNMGICIMGISDSKTKEMLFNTKDTKPALSLSKCTQGEKRLDFMGFSFASFVFNVYPKIQTSQYSCRCEPPLLFVGGEAISS